MHPFEELIRNDSTLRDYVEDLVSCLAEASPRDGITYSDEQAALWNLAIDSLYALASIGHDYVRDLDQAGLAKESRRMVDRLRQRGFDRRRARRVWEQIVADVRGNDELSNALQKVAGVHQSKDQAVFCREQKQWRLSYDGETVFLTDLKGLHYIRLLLQQPLREFSALQLVQLVHAPPHTTSDADGLPSDGARAEPLLDGQALEEIKRQLDELDAEILGAKESGNVTRQAELQLKKDDILEAMEEFIPTRKNPRGKGDTAGWKHRPKIVPQELRNARTSVGNAVSRAIARLADDHPALHRHLHVSIKTGYDCSYRPETLINWLT